MAVKMEKGEQEKHHAEQMVITDLNATAVDMLAPAKGASSAEEQQLQADCKSL